jgi:hypothetical protein
VSDGTRTRDRLDHNQESFLAAMSQAPACCFRRPPRVHEPANGRKTAKPARIAIVPICREDVVARPHVFPGFAPLFTTHNGEVAGSNPAGAIGRSPLHERARACIGSRRRRAARRMGQGMGQGPEGWEEALLWALPTFGHAYQLAEPEAPRGPQRSWRASARLHRSPLKTERPKRQASAGVPSQAFAT